MGESEEAEGKDGRLGERGCAAVKQASPVLGLGPSAGEWRAAWNAQGRGALLAVEINADGDVYRGGFAVQLRRFVFPLLDGGQSRLMEQSRT